MRMCNRSPNVRLAALKKLTGRFFGELCIYLILLELGLRLGGVMFLFFQEHGGRFVDYKNSEYRILCLGNSTTALGGENSYSAQLGDILNQRYPGIKFRVLNKGRPHESIFTVLSHLENNCNKFDPDMVIIMIGAWDEGSIAEKNIFRFSLSAKIRVFLKSLRVYKLGKVLKDYAANRAPYSENVIPVSLEPELRDLLREDAELKLIDKNAEYRLGWWFLEKGRCREAEACFNKVIEQNPQEDKGYSGLGWCYFKQERIKEAEYFIKKAAQLNPANKLAYYCLGRVYMFSLEPEKAEESFKKFVELSGGNPIGYTCLGHAYRNTARYEDAEKMFAKALEASPKDYWARFNLAKIYSDRGNYAQAEALLKTVMQWDFDNGRLGSMYGELALLYTETGRYELAREYYNKAEELRLQYYQPVVQDTFIKIKAILDKRRIKLVCVEYPLRSVEPLKRIFSGQEGVIFVDNEIIFKEALKKASYKKYFVDLSSVDFGHGTPLCNKLLAENIAQVILKEAFDK
ncbi:MAG: tetratricopeptide repeat protein [Candidatus Omnitrophota bacterium]